MKTKVLATLDHGQRVCVQADLELLYPGCAFNHDPSKLNANQSDRCEAKSVF